MTATPLVLFDGPCTLCQRSVRFILRHERSAQLTFASLQSATGQTALKQYHLPTETDAMVLIENEKAFQGSDAAFALCKYLRAPWSLGHVFRHLPGWLHRPLYRWIAKNRYRWFGKDESCPLPDPDQAGLFLE